MNKGMGIDNGLNGGFHMDRAMDRDELKRKLRSLKKLEIKMRFNGALPKEKRIQLVWEDFFSTGDTKDSKVRYSLEELEELNRDQLKAVFDEYFYRVYYQKYQENGIIPGEVYDPELLSVLGLSQNAGLIEIRKRFRELAKIYHPDHGGDSSRMIELLETYHKLTDR